MARIYVGNLPMDIRTRDVEDIFYKYGRIRDIEIKLPNRPPAFAFVEFDDDRDAEDAVRGRNGYSFDGSRLRVELANGRRTRERERGGGGRGGGGGGRDGGPRPNLRRSEWGVVVSGLPPSASWQDLKDCMRQAGNVCYTDVERDGHGVVEFTNREAMDYALDKLDGTEFRNRYDSSTIRVRARDSRSRSRSRSRRRSRSRSDSRGRRRGSRSRSPEREKEERGRSRSRSVSPKKTEEGAEKAEEMRSRSRSPVKMEVDAAGKEGEEAAPEAGDAQEERERSPSPPRDHKGRRLHSKKSLDGDKKSSEDGDRAREEGEEADVNGGGEESMKSSPSPERSGEKRKSAQSMTVLQLREELKKRGLDTSGLKAVLVERVEQAWANDQ